MTCYIYGTVYPDEFLFSPPSVQTITMQPQRARPAKISFTHPDSQQHTHPSTTSTPNQITFKALVPLNVGN